MQSRDKQPARILIKAPNWLGDVVMSLPAVAAIRAAYPRAEIAVLVRQELASFFDGVEWIDHVIGYRIGKRVAGLRDRVSVIRGLRRDGFDLAVILPRSFASALWAALARIPQRIGMKADARAWLL